MKTLNRTHLFILIIGVFSGLLAGALIKLIAAPPHGQPVELRPAPTPAPILVDVTGAVLQPGVYPLARDSRVQDAINAAGGLSEAADRAAVNLAARVRDGDKVSIPELGQAPAEPVVQAAPVEQAGRSPADLALPDAPPAEATASPTPAGPVNLNTATLEELQTLPGIGPSKAQDIIDYRQVNGAFKAIEEIQNIKGIGPATFEKLKEHITVD